MPGKERKFKLKQPDRSGPDPSAETLLDIAEKRNLGEAQRKRQAEVDAENEEILIGRLGESLIWAISLIMLHFTLDVMVTHQYAQELIWQDIISRTLQAAPGMLYIVFAYRKKVADSNSHLASLLRLSSTPRTFTPISSIAYQSVPLYARNLLFHS
ncbi:hypothetical protein NHQ30_001466 [Ciborinia camelliae]|nr:hypothetical protein NHQ30_001466 [Ciborinia camelliae]